MSRLVEFEDLVLLDGNDLKAVFAAMAHPQLLEALAGASAGLRIHLLNKLPLGAAARIADQLQDLGLIPVEVSHLAQREMVDTLCRLGRSGHIAFDDPYDMFPDSMVA